MSLRAELLRLSMKAWKLSRSKRRHTSMAKVRSRLRLIEPVVPRPPSGTRSTAIDVDGIKAIEILVPEARTDRHVLYFHGGGYAFATESLVRDFTWRLGIATGGIVLYFDYRLAPEHPFPAAVEDAAKVFRWLAARMNPDRIAFIGDSAGGGLLLATLHKMRDEGFKLPGAAVALSPWTDLALTGQSLHSNAGSDPLMDVKRLPAYAQRYLAGAIRGILMRLRFTGTHRDFRRCSSRSAAMKSCATIRSGWLKSSAEPVAKLNSRNGCACRTAGTTTRASSQRDGE